MEQFLLGTHEPSWLATANVPLFVSVSRLKGRKTYPRALAVWGMDGAGFSDITKHGAYQLKPAAYATEVQRAQHYVGNMAWAATQDYMCEYGAIHGGMVGHVRAVGTGLTLLKHQELTVQSYLDLRALAPNTPWSPCLQGGTIEEYLRCARMFAAVGVDLRQAPVVGVGSLCRRSSGPEICGILHALHTALPGVRLHGFGVKLAALQMGCAPYIVSCDSTAWSFDRRWAGGQCPHSNRIHCGNCLHAALAYRDEVLAVLAKPPSIFDMFVHRG